MVDALRHHLPQAEHARCDTLAGALALLRGSHAPQVPHGAESIPVRRKDVYHGLQAERQAVAQLDLVDEALLLLRRHVESSPMRALSGL